MYKVIFNGGRSSLEFNSKEAALNAAIRLEHDGFVNVEIKEVS